MDNQKINHKKKKPQKKIYYSFLTIVLAICIIQMTIGAFLNISKCIMNKAKINKMLEYKNDITIKNQTLKDEFKDFNSLKSLEAIARNNLKMAGEDEVLVLLNKHQNTDESSLNNNKFIKIVKH